MRSWNAAELVQLSAAASPLTAMEMCFPDLPYDLQFSLLKSLRALTTQTPVLLEPNRRQLDLQKNRTPEFKRPLLDRSSSARHRIASHRQRRTHTPHTHTQQITISSRTSTSAHLAPTTWNPGLGTPPHFWSDLLDRQARHTAFVPCSPRSRSTSCGNTHTPTPQHPTTLLVVEIRPIQPTTKPRGTAMFSFRRVFLYVPPISVLPLSAGWVGHGILLQGFKPFSLPGTAF